MESDEDASAIILDPVSENCPATESNADEEAAFNAQGQLPQLEADSSFKQTHGPSQATGVITYKKTPSRSTKSGVLYEVKLATLLYLRAINSKQPFYLATNMAAARAFDDIVLRRYVDNKWCTTFIQLKHKATSKIGFGPLLSMSRKSDFGFVKYGASFKEIKADFETKDDLKCCGNFEDSEFMVYTNAQGDCALKKDVNENTTKNQSLFSTGEGGLVFKFGNTSRPFQGIREIVDFKTLLNKLTLELSGVHAEIAKKKIEQNVQMFNVSAFNTELVAKKSKLLEEPILSRLDSTLNEMSLIEDLTLFEEFLGKLHLYTGQANEVELDEFIAVEIRRAFYMICESDVTALSGELYSLMHSWWSGERSSGPWLTENSNVWKSIVALRVDQISSSKQVGRTGDVIKFGQESVDQLRKAIIHFRLINVVVKEETISLIASKVQQSLQSELFIYIGLRDLIARRDEVVCVWRNELCDGLVIECDEQATEEEIMELASDMVKAITKQGNLRCVLVSKKDHSLTRTLHNTSVTFTRVKDNCGWYELTAESQTFLREREVFFQGHPMVLKDLINDNHTLANLVHGRLLGQLAKGEHKIGQDLDKTIDYYIPRKLSRENTSIDIGSLTDVGERTLVVIAEPGMGKTTLLTHLAQAAKITDPSCWVVRINLIDCTSYLATLNKNQIDGKSAIEFFNRFAYESGSDLEVSMFRDRMFSRGNIVALIDGIDEVCPFYEEVICSILKHLKETKILRLLVTSRIFAKESLEEALGVKSFVLVAFTPENQSNFFKAFWKPKFINDELSLEDFVAKVIKLASKTFQGDNMTVAIPLQTRMLAEYFNEHLDAYTKSGILPDLEHINLMKLFHSFFEKKIAIHFEEKKKDNLNNAAVKIDNETLKTLILENHQFAALKVLLSPEELSSLKYPFEKQAKFLQQVTSGEEKIGIITAVVHNRPQFVHRTFCEYFVAIWFSQNYRNETCQRFLQNSLFEPRFEVVRSLLDLHLSRTSDLHEAVINRNLSAMKRLLSTGTDVNQKDEGGRTALHLATAYCGKDKQHQLQIVATLLAHGARIDVLDDLLHWNPLKYAGKFGAWALASLIIQAGGKEVDMEETKSTINAEVFVKLIAYLSDPNSSYVDLMLAASIHGDLSVVKFLVEECRADVNCRGVGGVTPMHVSSEFGQVDVMRFLRQNGASVQVTDQHKNQPLHCAAMTGQTQAIGLLLDPGNAFHGSSSDCSSVNETRLRNAETLVTLFNQDAEVNTSNADGMPPLLCSMSQGHESAASLLISKGADVNARTNKGWTSLMYAVQQGNTDLIEILNSEGAKIEDRPYKLTEKQNNITLLFAAYMGNVFLTKQMIPIYRTSLYANDQGTTPIHWAVMKNNPECVNLLLGSGANINAREKQGMTPLFNVCNMYPDTAPTEQQERDAIAMLDLLIRNGADVGVKVNNNQDFRSFALERKHYVTEKYIKELAVNENADTILHIAIKRGELKTIIHLLEHNGGLNLTNKSGDTIQHQTAMYGQLNVLTYLVNVHKVDLTVTNINGDTLQHLASAGGSLDTLKYLVNDHKLDINVTNKDLDRPLHLAACKGNLDVAQYLIGQGADPKARNKAGQRPIDRVCSTTLDMEEMTQLLSPLSYTLYDRFPCAIH